MKTNRLVVGLLPILIAIPITVFRSFQAHYPKVQSISATLPSSSDSPVAYFDASVAQLRIRKYPDLNAAVTAEVPEGGRLKYLNETGGTPIEVTLRGIKHRGRWYKVSWEKYNKDTGNTKVVEGWVFTGGVVLSDISLNGTPLDQLNFDFFKVTKLSETDFDAQAALYNNDYSPNVNRYAKKKGPIILPLNNGKVKMINDSLCKEPTSKPLEYDQHYFMGNFKGFGLYLMAKECKHSSMLNYLINKSNGQIVYSYRGGKIPLFSPNGEKMALLFTEGSGGFRVDFGIFRSSNWTTFSLIDDDGYLEEVIWSQDSQQCLVKWNFYDAAGEKKATEYYSIPFGPLE